MRNMDISAHVTCAMTSVLKAWRFNKNTRFELVSVCNSNAAYRITLYPEQGGTVALFLKFLPDTSNNDLFIYFENEVKFYSYIMPAFTEFINQYITPNMKAVVPILGVPKCFYAVSSEYENILVLEDLLFKGYKSKSLPEITAKDLHNVMKSLGQFHGISLAFSHQNSDVFAILAATTRETLFRAGETRVQRLLQLASERALKFMKEEFPKNSLYVKKVKEFVRHIVEMLSKMVRLRDEDRKYGVITHGHIHVSNLFFKDSVCFTDFTQCRFASPALDVSSVLYLLVDKKIHNVHRHSLIHTYYKGLSEILKIYNLNPHVVFPYTVLKQHIYKYSGFTIGISLLYLQLNTYDLDENVSNFWRPSSECKTQIVENLKEAVNNEWLNI